jgi:hypothetical protein
MITFLTEVLFSNFYFRLCMRGTGYEDWPDDEEPRMLNKADLEFVILTLEYNA